MSNDLDQVVNDLAGGRPTLRRPVDAPRFTDGASVQTSGDVVGRMNWLGGEGGASCAHHLRMYLKDMELSPSHGPSSGRDDDSGRCHQRGDFWDQWLNVLQTKGTEQNV
ncbi:hypothetical protein EVAR_75440_1 [Eumeta japonica]|uniref:Uncharacterized protein n=1 Tax=Eumeta variegata TaxID=151549 RepID=A0A4C1TL84_EUMVA|nr:hypothetical protein EVAR_75440_1 [Eumeta japonica]